MAWHIVSEPADVVGVVAQWLSFRLSDCLESSEVHCRVDAMDARTAGRALRHHIRRPGRTPVPRRSSVRRHGSPRASCWRIVYARRPSTRPRASKPSMRTDVAGGASEKDGGHRLSLVWGEGDASLQQELCAQPRRWPRKGPTRLPTLHASRNRRRSRTPRCEWAPTAPTDQRRRRCGRSRSAGGFVVTRSRSRTGNWRGTALWGKTPRARVPGKNPKR